MSSTTTTGESMRIVETLLAASAESGHEQAPGNSVRRLCGQL